MFELAFENGDGARKCFMTSRVMVMAPIRRVDSPSINPVGNCMV